MKPIELAAISIKNRLEAEKIEVPFDYEPEAPKTYEEAERLRLYEEVLHADWYANAGEFAYGETWRKIEEDAITPLYAEIFCALWHEVEEWQPEQAAAMIEWLCGTDFFSAPASTRFHLNVRNGLMLHSMSVACETLRLLEDDEAARADLGEDWRPKAIAAALLHDICKADFYTPRIEEKEYEDGTIGTYQVRKLRLLDHTHGEKSMSICREIMPALSGAPLCAINWHMGEFDHRIQPMKTESAAAKSAESIEMNRGVMEAVYEQHPFAHLLHEADIASAKAGR
jgi:hypothetical protein